MSESEIHFNKLFNQLIVIKGIILTIVALAAVLYYFLHKWTKKHLRVMTPGRNRRFRSQINFLDLMWADFVHGADSKFRRIYHGFWVMVKLIVVGMTPLGIFYLAIADPLDAERVKRWTWDAGVFLTLSSIIYLMIRGLVFREPFPSLSIPLGRAPERAETSPPQRRTRKHKQSRRQM